MPDTSKSTEANYLKDLVLLLREAATASVERHQAAEPLDREYQSGRAMAYYEVLSLIELQELAFGMEPGTLLGDFSPDRDLLGRMGRAFKP